MASFHRENTLTEGDRPAEHPEGSSKNAIQSPTVDASQNTELVLFKKPILDVSTVVTRNTLEEVSVHYGCFNHALNSTNHGT